MEIINLEKFIYSSKCDVEFIVNDNDDKTIKKKVSFLYSMNAIYFLDSINNYSTTEEIELEKILIFKMIHENYYLLNYEFDHRYIIYKNRDEV
jgi:hypothetical protein